MERKRKLDGRVAVFHCGALELGGARAVLRYVLPAPADLPGVHLPAGTISFGVFWSDRPYNVYQFVGAAGVTLAYYCNAAADTHITAAGVDWLDLEADVLILPAGRARVLDLDEVPPDLASDLRRELARALRALRRPAEVLAAVRAATGPHGAGQG